MNDTYFITAKTVEEAYAIANRKYADDQHEVSCEVVEMPKKGFLGIGAKEAKIKVTVTKSVAADLGSLVADMKSMKSVTDRGGDGKKNEQNRQPGQQNRQGQQRQQNPQKQNRDGEKKEQNRQQGQPAQQKQPKPQNQPKPTQTEKPAQSEKPAQPAQKPQEQNNKPKSALRNQAKPNTRTQMKHVDGDVKPSGTSVSKPMGLTDFVPEQKSGFGSSSKSGGSMNNDVRRKKPKGPTMSAAKADEKMLSSRYDMAESEDDYASLDLMERENEAMHEKEANRALGFGGQEEVEEVAEVAVPEVPAEPVKREPITQAEMDFALEFANTLLANMNLTARAVPAECPEDEEFEPQGDANVYPKIDIVGDDTGILIGHHGETLDAIQYLVNLSALRKTKSKDGDYVKIVVDIENYREKRAATLKTLARRMAAKAVKYKRNVFLEPMNAYERRIIHSELQNYPEVSTHSVGTDRDRKIIITYEGADKLPDNRPRRRRGGQGRRNGDRQNRAERAEKPENVENAESASVEPAERRRPRKLQKVPFEQLTDVLEGNSFLDSGKTPALSDEE